MKKLLSLFLLMVVGVSCKKPEEKTEDPTPVATTCLIQNVVLEDGYVEGHYTKYKFDASNMLSEVTVTFEIDQEIQGEVTMKFTYNADGYIAKSSSVYGEDLYTYTAGKLTGIVFKDEKGEIYEEFTITVDSQNRLSKVITKTDGFVCNYEYNASGWLNKSEILWQNKIYDRYEITDFEKDPAKKSHNAAIKGHFFDPTVFTNSMIYFPFNPKGNDIGLDTKSFASTMYDENWEDVTNTLRVYYDINTTRKFNSNNFTTERYILNNISKEAFKDLYVYSNCN